MKNPNDLVLELAEKIIDFSNKGNKAKATTLLQTFYSIINEYPQVAWNKIEVWKLAKALLIMYHYDIIEGEDENIKIAERAYVYSQRSVELYETSLQEKENSQEDYFQALHTQVVLMETCEDCYLLTLEQFYAKSGGMTKEELKVARSLSREIAQYVAYSNLDKIEQEFDGFRNDAYLEEICNKIELDQPEISEKQIELGQKMNKMMVKALGGKI